MGQVIGCLRPSRRHNNRRPRQNLSTSENKDSVPSSPVQDSQAKKRNERDFGAEQQQIIEPRKVDNSGTSATPNSDDPHTSIALEPNKTERLAAARKNNGLSAKFPQYEALVNVDTAVQELEAIADRRDATAMRGTISPGYPSENRKENGEIGNSSGPSSAAQESEPPVNEHGALDMRRLPDEASEDWQNFTQPTLDSVEGSISDVDDNERSEFSLEGGTLQLRLPEFEPVDETQKIAAEQSASHPVVVREITRLLSVREGIALFDNQNAVIEVAKHSGVESLSHVGSRSEYYPYSPVTSPLLRQNSSANHNGPPE